MLRVASLPMYDIPELHSAFGEFWRGLASHLTAQGLTDVPSELAHGDGVNSLWGDPRLFFSQSCGYDVVSRYTDTLAPIAVPHFDAPGCSGAEYVSLIIVRDDSPATDVLDMRDKVVAINGAESHSGMSALRHLVASKSEQGKFFSEVKVSGAHVGSIELVKKGEADLATIDCITFALLERHRPETVWGLRVLGRTFSAPAPPYVIRRQESVEFAEAVCQALQMAFDDPKLRSARQRLLLKQVERIDVGNYQKILAFEDHANSFGYGTLG